MGLEIPQHQLLGVGVEVGLILKMRDVEDAHMVFEKGEWNKEGCAPPTIGLDRSAELLFFERG